MRLWQITKNVGRFNRTMVQSMKVCRRPHRTPLLTQRTTTQAMILANVVQVARIKTGFQGSHGDPGWMSYLMRPLETLGGQQGAWRGRQISGQRAQHAQIQHSRGASHPELTSTCTFARTQTGFFSPEVVSNCTVYLSHSSSSAKWTGSQSTERFQLVKGSIATLKVKFTDIKRNIFQFFIYANKYKIYELILSILKRRVIDSVACKLQTKTS
jgi:hypothetical protein